MARRESLFPSGSIGRSGATLQRTSSHESLTTHPLLTPPPGSSSFPTSSSPAPSISTPSAADTPSPSQAPRYVPYTPRHRGAPSPATTTPATGTTAHPTPPDRDAANRLQLMHLKAAAQKAGLDAASTGWVILEKFALEGERTTEWNELWNAVTEGKATLLLPRDPHPSNVVVNAEFMKDHVAFCDSGAGSKTTSVTTLSGLRGYIADHILTFRSTLSPTSKPFQALLTPSTRVSAYYSLAPLPRHISISPPPAAEGHHRQHSRSAPSYPTFTVQTHTSTLPLPPRPTPVKGPPLPPRPIARQTLPASSGSASSARLSNPFAHLFGRATASSPTPPASPTISTSSLPAPADPVPSSSPGSSTAVSPPASITGTEHAPAYEVPAYVISGRIQRGQVLGGLVAGVSSELEDVLASEGVPVWVREKVAERTQWLGPVAYGRAPPAADGRRRVSGLGAGAGSVRGRGAAGSDGASWEIAGELADVVEGGGIEEVARRLQEFWAGLEEEVGARWKEDTAKERHRRRWGRNGKTSSGSEGESEKDRDEEEKEADNGEHDDGEDSPQTVHVRRVMDAVEKTVCSLYYDRLFLPPGTDDASHDEALSSRIAAVNLLDLGLGHLGVEVGVAGRQVESLIKACGQALMQLDSVCRSPADKAATLVSVHKILVDGLSRLPPLRLKAEDEILEEKTPVASSFRKSVHDDEDEVDRSVSPPPAVIVSPISDTHPSERATENSALLTPDDASGTSESTGASSTSPILTVSPPPEPSSAFASPAPAATPVSGDIILPLMIFAVVKANPPHLVSHLLFTQRFRRERAAGGEEGYCLINLMAVAEFLENVDLAALGLGESEKMVISTAELTPIPISRPGSESGSPRVPQSSLRGRVEQQVDSLAGSANKVLTGVVDTSFGVLRALLPGQASNPQDVPTPPIDADQSAAPWNISQPRFGLLRRDTHFSIASIAASLPGRSKASQPEESGQQMTEVPSRPGSSRSMRPEEQSEEESEEDEESEEESEEEELDARSIRSFESMMSQRSRQARKRKTTGGRKSLADRLASVPGLSRLSQGAPTDASKASPPASRRSSLLVPPQAAPKLPDSPTSSRPQSPIAIRISPPNARFMNCTEDDIKVSEVGELLREYKRLAEAVRAMGGFHEDQ
ncbi:hypothetical protein C8Q80DRAFT_1221824 [Daedaleopsis nitida]|nr:hypothetical protein C8Q80DRAFT_1221824 [Daedaleopsis nitida]